jgi:CTP:molybdopterin cytidylyltransferase MocA
MVQAFAGLILAGGTGERFGGPKAFARLPDRRSFLDCCAATLATAGAQPIVATLPPGAASLAHAGLDPLVLPERGLDMFASLRLGLGRLLADPGWAVVAVWPVDHPLVTAATVRELVSVAAPRRGSPPAPCRDRHCGRFSVTSAAWTCRSTIPVSSRTATRPNASLRRSRSSHSARISSGAEYA